MPKQTSTTQLEQTEFTELQLKDLEEKAKEIEIYNSNYILKNINKKDTSWIALSESALFCFDILEQLKLKVFKKDLRRKIEKYLKNFNGLEELRTLVKDYKESIFIRPSIESKLKEIISPYQTSLNNLINFTLSIKKLEAKLKEEKVLEEKWKKLPVLKPKKKRRKTHSI